MVGENKSLYGYLQGSKIVIPRIQRDYAQGRKDKTTIRNSILSTLFNTLEKDEEKTTLDFVYGTVEDGVLKPLDGQQRLTTLWLVHWYISFYSKHLKDDAEALRNFTYETRSSSREFVKGLCDKMKDVDPSTVNGSIVLYIQNQNWFYNEWKYDPTIQSMLRMIGGDEGSDIKREKTCIEDFFSDKKTVDFERYRESLISSDSKKISFILLEIKKEEVPIPDKLYIKMNARGKRLSDFESFKAHLLGHVKTDIYASDVAKQREFSTLLDNKWTQIVWDWARNGDNKECFNGYIDGLFFTFVNRLVLNEIMLDENTTANKMDKNASFAKLYGLKLAGNDPDDRLITYDGFGVYKKYITEDFIDRFEKIMDTLDKDADLRKNLLPEYDKDKKDDRDNYYPKAIGQSERCRILAYCIYINWKNIVSMDPSKDILNRWIRVVDNIINNSYIATVDDMVFCIREIGNLGNHISKTISDTNKDLYSIIKDYDPYNKVLKDKSCNDTGRQMKEEIEKAKAISDGIICLKDIEDAEERAFFNGSIRFLVDEIDDPKNGTVTIWDWRNFVERDTNANNLFSKSEPCIPVDTYRSFITFLYEKDPSMPVECMISRSIVDTKKGNFKRQYMKDDLEDIRDFLLNKTQTSINTKKTGPFYDCINSTIINHVLNSENGKYSIKVKTVSDNGKSVDVCCFYKVVQNSTSYIYVDENHKKWSDELKNTLKIETEAEYYDGIGYFGKTITFKYNGADYTWTMTKYENELHKNRGSLTLKWHESDSSVSIIAKINQL